LARSRRLRPLEDEKWGVASLGGQRIPTGNQWVALVWSRTTILGVFLANALAAWMALRPQAALAFDGYSYPYYPGYCCACGYVPCGISALDEPLRCYFVPRRPGWPENDYCYRVAGPRPCPCPGEAPFPDELACHCTPWGFERLGQIPGDALLDAGAAASR